MKDLLMNIKGYCDSLTSCGEVISEYEHVIAILNGLSPEYESIITIITTSQLPSSVQNITTMLLDAEARMQSTVAEIPSSTNMVTHEQTTLVVESDSTSTYRPTSSSLRGRGRGRMSDSRIQCQLCGKTRHLVDRCYHSESQPILSLILLSFCINLVV
ncbi:hypothetical protein PVK06_043406 [Gossypium arboreum]|uniref:Uncharacterized protein n=1 Tax=Gossypium arboreum TaxID=29729 RepID=A0ABR0MNF2_GOSAR|nr:hypothetical protein PVK06_043406 [Gossypium arboreum]